MIKALIMRMYVDYNCKTMITTSPNPQNHIYHTNNHNHFNYYSTMQQYYCMLLMILILH